MSETKKDCELGQLARSLGMLMNEANAAKEERDALRIAIDPRQWTQEHSIMAECYGTLGALLAEIEKLRAELFEWQALRDPHVLHSNLLRGLPAQLSREQLRHVLGDPPSRDDGATRISRRDQRARRQGAGRHGRISAN